MEHFDMVLCPTTYPEYNIEKAIFEAHGTPKKYDPTAVQWLDKTHAAITIGLNNHAIWSRERESNPVDEGGSAGFVLTGDFFGDKSNTW
jgi:hypothetical protein